MSTEAHGLRDTYAHIDTLSFRPKAAADLIGVTPFTLKANAEDAGIDIPRTMVGRVSTRTLTPSLIFDLVNYRRTAGLQKVHEFKRPIVSVSYVIKGGTGKTTTAAETAFNLQLMGLKVLLIDLDVQANLTSLMGYEPDLTADEIEDYGSSKKAVIDITMKDFIEIYLTNKSPANPAFEDALKYPFGPNGPALLASDQYLCDLDTMITQLKGPRELILKRFFNSACAGEVPGLDLSNFDWIMIDCPPQTTFTTRAALAAADIVIAPVRMDAFAIKGLSRLVDEVNSLETDYSVKSPDLCILRTHYSQQVVRTYRMHQGISVYKDSVCEDVINVCEDFPATIDNYMPLTIQRPSSSGARDYRSFATSIYSKAIELSKTLV